MAIVGKSVKLAELAKRLAPGRNITRIQLDFPARGLCTAIVHVQLEEGDVPVIEQLVDEAQPHVTIVEDTASLADQFVGEQQPMTARSVKCQKCGYCMHGVNMTCLKCGTFLCE